MDTAEQANKTNYEYYRPDKSYKLWALPDWFNILTVGFAGQINIQTDALTELVKRTSSEQDKCASCRQNIQIGKIYKLGIADGYIIQTESIVRLVKRPKYEHCRTCKIYKYGPISDM